jgi:hypothetical protein
VIELPLDGPPVVLDLGNAGPVVSQVPSGPSPHRAPPLVALHDDDPTRVASTRADRLAERRSVDEIGCA